MMTFEELYLKLTKAAVNNKIEDELKQLQSQTYHPNDLDCLLHPKEHPPIYRTQECSCSQDEKAKCAGKCLFDAIKPDEKGNLVIDKELCTGCAVCVENCQAKKLTASRDILPALTAIHNKTGPVYALIAPAFHGQFSPNVTPGMLRNAFKQLGFDGMIEVALFADILTLKEALEFQRNITSEQDFQLTSCCCPMWIAMIRKIYHELIPHVPGSVSPMIAAGRTVKLLHPNATTIFIGPCVAKKAEAREKDLVGAIDFVLTFQEIEDVFQFAQIDPNQMEDSAKDHSSRAGRIYAKAGGVSEAVKSTVERLSPNKSVTIKTKRADGIPACKQMIQEILSGNHSANFFEGMGCIGGCVGGPKVLINKEKGKENVEQYGKAASYLTPIDNPYVIELLKRLNLDSVESLLEDSEIFTRNF